MNSSLSRVTAALSGPLLMIALALTFGCASLEKDETIDWTPDKLYSEAKDEMASGSYARAIKLLEKLESRYPFGRWAQQAQLDLAYAQYKDNEPATALGTIDRFLKQHPNHAAGDYALYLRGLINFNENQGFFARFGGQDLSERDQKAARESFDTFRDLLQRYPDSRYSDDARARMRYLVNAIANSEMHVARYYFRRGAYVASANRAQAVVRQYQQIPIVEEALYIMMSSYERLGMRDLRDDAERVLKQNFPDSKFLTVAQR
jgi:outer membrane protein assembly factor BamD